MKFGIRTCLFIFLGVFSTSDAVYGDQRIGPLMSGGDWAALLDIYLPRAGRGNAEAQDQIGSFYYRGVGVRKNRLRAEYWLREAAQRGATDAPGYLATWYGKEGGPKFDLMKAIKWSLVSIELSERKMKALAESNENFVNIFKSLAKQSDLESLSHANKSVLDSYRVMDNLSRQRLVELRSKASDDIENKAEEEAAKILAELGNPRVSGKIIKRVKSGAQNGNEDDQFSFAIHQIYAEKNDHLGMIWLERAAAQDHGLAQFLLGLKIFKNSGNTRSQVALNWLEKSAKNGVVRGMFTLGAMYADISGNRDYSKARFWLKKAADLGHGAANHTLGLMSLIGLGVKKNAQSAVGFFYKGSRQRNHDSMFELAKLYLSGTGTEKDKKQAKKIFKFLSSRGHKPAIAWRIKHAKEFE